MDRSNNLWRVDKMSESLARWLWVKHGVVGLILASLEFSGSLAAVFSATSLLMTQARTLFHGFEPGRFHTIPAADPDYYSLACCNTTCYTT